MLFFLEHIEYHKLNLERNFNMSEKKDTKDNTTSARKEKHPAIWIFSIVILVLIIITFVAGPAISGFLPSSSSQELSFGSYNGEPITYSYNSYFYRQRESVASNWDEEVTDQNYQWQMYQIWRTAFNNTVFFMDLMQRAEKAGLEVTENRLNEYLLNNGPYINENGSFDKEIYNNTLQSERQEIRNQIHDEFIQQQVITDLFNTFSNQNEAKFVIEQGKEEKAFDYISFKLNEYPAEQVKAYAIENMMLFSQVNLSTISLGEDELEAESVYEKLQNEELTFEEAAQTYSKDSFSNEGGNLGWTYFYDLRSNVNSDEEANSIFSLKSGDISNLIETEFGYSIYKVNETPQPPDLDDENTIGDIRSYLVQNEKALLEDYFIEKAESFIVKASKDGFNSAASELGKEVYSTNPAPLNYGGTSFLKTLSQADSEGLLGNESDNEFILKELFSQGVGDLTEAMILSNSITVAKCTDKQTVEDERINSMVNIFPYYLQQIQQQELSSMILESDKLEDNFMNIFFSQISPLNTN